MLPVDIILELKDKDCLFKYHEGPRYFATCLCRKAQHDAAQCWRLCVAIGLCFGSLGCRLLGGDKPLLRPHLAARSCHCISVISLDSPHLQLEQILVAFIGSADGPTAVERAR